MELLESFSRKIFDGFITLEEFEPTLVLRDSQRWKIDNVMLFPLNMGVSKDILRHIKVKHLIEIKIGMP